MRLGYEHRDWRAYPALSARGGGDLPCGGPLLVQVRGATFATTRVEVAAETGVRFGLASGGNAVWLGPLYAFRAGSADSVVARGVADHERGLWLAGGLETPGVVLSVGNQLGGDAVEGRLTVREVLDRPSPAPWPCEAEAGVIPWGHQPRANEWTLRALVGWPSEHPLVQRLRGTIEGLRGELDLPNTYDMSGSVRRVLAGVQLAAWPTPEQGPVVQPYLGVAAGLQRSEVHNESHYGVTEERVARTAVASGEAGVRLGWSGRSWRSGATVAWAWVEVQRDVEVPWRSAGEEGTSALSADGPEGHLRWWVAIGW